MICASPFASAVFAPRSAAQDRPRSLAAVVDRADQRRLMYFIVTSARMAKTMA
jgi:hypothetical protein